jgi:hypothetical protein
MVIASHHATSNIHPDYKISPNLIQSANTIHTQDNSLFNIHLGVDEANLPSINHNPKIKKLKLIKQHDLISQAEQQQIKQQLTNLPNKFNVTFGIYGNSATNSLDDANNQQFNLPNLSNHLSINNNQANPTSSTLANPDIVFITDDVLNSLVRCQEQESNIYLCQNVVNNLTNPQKMLLIEPNLYILNMADQESGIGSVTRCLLNQDQQITSCDTTALPISQPAYFYYNPPYIYISDFVYFNPNNPQAKPQHSIRCSFNNGNFIDCSQNNDLSNLFFISTNFQNNSYRPNCAQHAIDKCTTETDINCQHLLSSYLQCPLNINFSQQQAYITNSASITKYTVLRCDPLINKCNIITQNLPWPVDTISVIND